MKKHIAILVMITLVFSLGGCATIFKGNSSPLKVNSDPENAKIFVNGEYVGRTPLKIHLKGDKHYTIEFRKEGFEPVVRRVHSRIGAGWIVLDIICGGMPVVVDALTGAWYHLDQEYVSAILKRQQP